MARVIQEHIKKPLADEVLFGKLKDGGHVKVIVVKTEATEGRPAEDKLAFEFLDGPVTPKPEKIPPVRPKAKRRPPNNGPRRPKPPGGPRGDGGGSPPSRGSVPKIPLERV